MAQLKMYWLPGTPIKEETLPEGYSFSNYKCEADKLEWCECCKNGLVADTANEATFYDRIASLENINIYDDVFFLDYNGQHIATVTTVLHSSGIGVVEMVGMKTEWRGKGLGKYLNYIALKTFSQRDVKFVELTTDEWRKGAVKSYLNAGFLPVEYAIGMQDRWERVLETYGIESVQMVYEDTTPFKVIYRKSKAPKVKFGVVGSGRGRTMMDYCRKVDNAELVAVCENSPERLAAAEKDFGDGKIKFYADYDEFLKHDMDCVVLANFANAHAPFAIKALNCGKNVLSEVLPVQTLKEAVELIETVEKTGLTYAYAENYCFMPAPKKMRELYRKGVLGDFEYGEGEYVHNCEPGWHRYTGANPEHWRNTMSAFYYCTHSMGPLIHITGLRPVSVTGTEVAFNARMMRMGAKAGPMGIETVTLENGAVLKSLHGVGPSKNSIWYSIYGSKGRMESAREDSENGGVNTLYVNCDKNEGENRSYSVKTSTDDAISQFAAESGHGGSDFYVMYNLVQHLRGNRNADIVDVYEALDMFLPGLFAHFSALEGGKPMAIPNLRDKAERDKYRSDTRCTDPAVAGESLIPSYSKGNPEIPDEVYDRLRGILNESADDSNMTREPIMGIQLYTLRDHIQNADDFDATLKRLKAMGVNDVQISGIGDFETAAQAKALRVNGMECCVTHKSFEKLCEDLDWFIDYHKAIDCDAIGIGSMPGEVRDTYEAVKGFIAKAEDLGARLKPHHMTFNYHNHDFEFKGVEGSDKTIMDILLEETTPDLFHFIPDVAWIHFAGKDPAEYLHKMKGRVKVVHFKDYIIDEEGKRKFVPLGEGVVNLKECYEACKELHIPYIMYEQDCDWPENDPFLATEISWKFMQSLVK